MYKPPSIELHFTKTTIRLVNIIHANSTANDGSNNHNDTSSDNDSRLYGLFTNHVCHCFWHVHICACKSPKLLWNSTHFTLIHVCMYVCTVHSLSSTMEEGSHLVGVGGSSSSLTGLFVYSNRDCSVFFGHCVCVWLIHRGRRGRWWYVKVAFSVCLIHPFCHTIIKGGRCVTIRLIDHNGSDLCFCTCGPILLCWDYVLMICAVFLCVCIWRQIESTGLTCLIHQLVWLCLVFILPFWFLFSSLFVCMCVKLCSYCVNVIFLEWTNCVNEWMNKKSGFLSVASVSANRCYLFAIVRCAIIELFQVIQAGSLNRSGI